MRINCPLCGERPLEEYTYRGDASLTRPDNSTDMAEWVDYVFMRDNPKGLHLEHWRHSSGCGAWLVVERDTVSHIIANVQLASEVSK